MKKSRQTKFCGPSKSSYGGALRNTRVGRSGPRPLSTKDTMHLVLRSTKAVVEWSFRKPRNKLKIEKIVSRFAKKYGVQIVGTGNADSHLHFQIKLSNRFTYKSFIRAILQLSQWP